MMETHALMVILVCLANVFKDQGALTVMMETPVPKMDVIPAKMAVCTGQQWGLATMKTDVLLVIFVRPGIVFREPLSSIAMMETHVRKTAVIRACVVPFP